MALLITIFMILRMKIVLQKDVLSSTKGIADGWRISEDIIHNETLVLAIFFILKSKAYLIHFCQYW